MSLSPEQQKANAKALCWLADKLRDFDPARFAEDKNLAPIPEEWKQFLYRGVRVRPEPTILMLNPFLINAIKYLTQKFGLRMVEATEALGVEDCSFEPLSVLPWILVERLPTVYPDGKHTVFQLAADAICPEPPVKLSKAHMEEIAAGILRAEPDITAEELGRKYLNGVSKWTVQRLAAWNRHKHGPRSHNVRAMDREAEEAAQKQAEIERLCAKSKAEEERDNKKYSHYRRNRHSE